MYPNNQTLVSLAEVKSLTGLTSASDASINALIPSITEQIESYLDRRLLKYNWYEWHHYNNQILLSQYPVNNILRIGTPTQVISITETSGVYNFNVEQADSTNTNITPSFIAVNLGSFAVTEFSFDTYTTLTDLKVAVEAAIPTATLDITVGYETQNTLCLRSGSGTKIYGVTKQDVLFRIDDACNRTLTIPSNVSIQFHSLDYWFETVLFVAYSAGYTSATTPAGLKLIISNIIKDTLNINSLGSSSLLKSESIKNYSYSLFDSSQISTLINTKYATDLEPYRKKILL